MARPADIIRPVDDVAAYMQDVGKQARGASAVLARATTAEKNAALAAGSLTGALLAGVATHPLDTIKSCMQGDLGREKYDGILQTGKSLANEYGVVQGLFKGLFWRVALISTTFFLVNTFKQQTMPLLFPHAVQDEPEKKSSR